MDNLSHGRVIGIDVSRDWLDVHCLPDGHRCKVPNAPAGHAAVADLARNRDAVVCFESTGGQEWQLWAVLEAKGVAARQVPPAQVKAFAQSRGTRAKTDRIDAELIALFFVFRPEAGRSLPAEKLRLLRALTTKRAQLVEMRKRLLAPIRAHQKLGTAVMFEDVDTELKQRIDGLIKELEDRITLPSRAMNAWRRTPVFSALSRGSARLRVQCWSQKCPGSAPSQAKRLPHLLGWLRSHTTAEPFAGNRPSQAVAVPCGT